MLVFVFSVYITQYFVLKSILLGLLTFRHKIPKVDLKVLSTRAHHCIRWGQAAYREGGTVS